jgi:hypothetical protein
MLIKSNEDPLLLIRGAFFYEDANGKSQLNAVVPAALCLLQMFAGLSELVLNSVEVVRPAFSQKQAVSEPARFRHSALSTSRSILS